MGTVGSGVVEGIVRDNQLLQQRTGQEVRIVGISARRRRLHTKNVDLRSIPWFDDPIDLARLKHIDVFVEVMGGGDGMALAASTAALEAGKTLVTANKAMLSAHGEHLAKLAEKHGKQLYFEAAIAGGVPVVKVVRESLAGNRITGVCGILNGTCNYIFTRRKETDLSLKDIINEAQRLGYAERDPSFDINGIDTAQKISLLTTLAFGVSSCFDSVTIRGIESLDPYDIQLASQMNLVPRHLGICRRTDSGIVVTATPAFVEKTSILGGVTGALNACIIEGDKIGRVVLIGPGAGKEATASAVLSDIADIAMQRQAFSFCKPASMLNAGHVLPSSHRYGCFYIRASESVHVVKARLKQNGIVVKDALSLKKGSAYTVEATAEDKLKNVLKANLITCVGIE